MRNENASFRYGNMVFRRTLASTLARTLAGLGTVALACVVLATDTARAEPAPQITLGALAHAGPGCPAGTTNVTLAGGQFINFLFAAFTVNASAVPPPPWCQVQVPIMVRPNTRLMLRNIRGRGSVQIPGGGQGAVRGNFKLGNCSPVSFYHSIPGPSAQSFAFLRPGSSCQTPCGANTMLRGRIYVTAQNPPAAPVDAEVTLRHAGVELEVVSC